MLKLSKYSKLLKSCGNLKKKQKKKKKKKTNKKKQKNKQTKNRKKNDYEQKGTPGKAINRQIRYLEINLFKSCQYVSAFQNYIVLSLIQSSKSLLCFVFFHTWNPQSCFFMSSTL